MQHRGKDVRCPPHLSPAKSYQHADPGSKSVLLLTQCDVWNSPIPAANPRHRPGNIPAPVYPTCNVAVSEVLRSAIRPVSSDGMKTEVDGNPGLHYTDN